MLFKALLCLLAAAFLPAAVRASGAFLPEKALSLTITHAYDTVALPGVNNRIYLVAVMDDAGALTPLEPFSQYAERLPIGGESSEALQLLAQQLQQAILTQTSAPLSPTDSGVTDDSGVVRFPASQPQLRPGLYLVAGTRTKTAEYVYSTAPFLVLIPARDPDSGAWKYDIAAAAKVERQELSEDYTVIKVWKDRCHPDRRPASITIQLLRDGEAWGAPVTLPINGEWKYTWHNLDTGHNWTIREEQPNGYLEPDIRQCGSTFVITNTCAEPPLPTGPETPQLPQTGQLWWPVPILAAVGLLLIVIGLIRRGKRSDGD